MQGVQTGSIFEESEHVSHLVVSDSAAPWTVALQAPLSMGFPRQEFWSGLPFPTSFLTQGQNRFASPALPGGFFTTSATWEAFD